MVIEIESIKTDGARLNDVLACHRKFLENIYALMRFLELRLAERDWDLVKNGGYAVTRNGFGSSLSSLNAADWFPTYVGIAFVPPGLAKLNSGVTNTDVPDTGLEVLFFQVRWLDMSPSEPTIWYGQLHVTCETSRKVNKWEDCQSLAFRRLQPDKKFEGCIVPFDLIWKNASAHIAGTYHAIPLTQINDEQDVITKVVEPALAMVKAL